MSSWQHGQCADQSDMFTSHNTIFYQRKTISADPFNNKFFMNEFNIAGNNTMCFGKSWNK